MSDSTNNASLINFLTSQSNRQMLLRYGSLLLLVFQNCSAVLLMRYTQSPTRPPFSIPIANLAVEVVKFLLCAAFIVFSTASSVVGISSSTNGSSSSTTSMNASSTAENNLNNIMMNNKDKVEDDHDNSNNNKTKSCSTPTNSLSLGNDESASSSQSLFSQISQIISHPSALSVGFYSLKQSIFQKQSLQMAVPATLFTIQNNLLFVALANLDATLFQVTYQLKLLCTAVLMVIMLGKELLAVKWFSLVLLFCGIVLTQLKTTSPSNNNKLNGVSTKLPLQPNDPTFQHQHQQYSSDFVMGMFAVVTCAMCSAFASVYFEKILKTAPAAASSSIAVRNVQLAIFSFGLNFLVWLMSSSTSAASAKSSSSSSAPSIPGNHNIGNAPWVFTFSIFSGFDSLVWALVFVQAAGGLLVAVVIKYCDNILKTFATSIAIIVNGLVSYLWLQFVPSGMFLIGACIVMISTTLYSL